jgi:hypothetical protein
MKTHELKIRPEFFWPVATGALKAQVRKDDERGFQIGDRLILAEYSDGKYTGCTLSCRVTFIAKDADFLLPGFALLGISREVDL